MKIHRKTSTSNKSYFPNKLPKVPGQQPVSILGKWDRTSPLKHPQLTYRQVRFTSVLFKPSSAAESANSQIQIHLGKIKTEAFLFGRRMTGPISVEKSGSYSRGLVVTRTGSYCRRVKNGSVCAVLSILDNIFSTHVKDKEGKIKKSKERH